MDGIYPSIFVIPYRTYYLLSATTPVTTASAVATTITATASAAVATSTTTATGTSTTRLALVFFTRFFSGPAFEHGLA